ncbi:hypothetical protein Esti_000163 [Eimeria stiedai]
MRLVSQQRQLLLLLAVVLLGLSSSSSKSASNSCRGFVVGANAERLQSGINIDAQEKAQKGFIIIWMSITLIFVVVLGVWFTLKISDAADPVIHSKFIGAT